MSDLKEFTTGVLAKTLNRSPDEVASLFDEAGNPKEDATQTIEGWHSAIVNAQREAKNKAIADQRNKALRESGEAWEKRLKGGLGIDFGDATGDDAVEKIREHIEGLGKATQVDPKDEASIKSSAVFRKLEADLLKQLKAKDEEFTQKWAERDAKDQREVTMRTVKGKAEQLLAEMKPRLSEDPAKAKKQQRLYEMDLAAYQYEIDGEEIIVKNEKGERVENAQGHPMKFDEIVKGIITSNYDIPVADTKSSAGDVTKGSKTTGQGGAVLKKPANDDEYAKELHKIDTDKSYDFDTKVKLKSELKSLYKPAA